MASNDFVMTIDSDEEEDSTKPTKSKELVDDTQLNPDFTFDLHGDPYIDLLEDTNDIVKTGSKPVSADTITLYMIHDNGSSGRFLSTTSLNAGDCFSPPGSEKGPPRTTNKKNRIRPLRLTP